MHLGYLCVLSPKRTTRGGTSNRGGRCLEQADTDNNTTYAPVLQSGLGALYCLGAEVYGRWSAQAVQLVPLLAREHARGLHSRIRKGATLGMVHKWWGIPGITLQNAIAQCFQSVCFRCRATKHINKKLLITRDRGTITVRTTRTRHTYLLIPSVNYRI